MSFGEIEILGDEEKGVRKYCTNKLAIDEMGPAPVQ